MRCSLFVLIAFIGHLVPATAQQTSKRTCRILFLAAPSDAPKALFLADGSSAQQVELPSMNLSKVYTLPAGDITLTMLPAMPQPKVPLPANAPKATVAEALRDIYLLVATDPANKTAPVRFQVIDANVDGFKNGQLLWFNLSPHRIGGKIGSETLDLATNSKTILKAPATNSSDYNVKIGYLPAGTQRTEPVCETIWLHDPKIKNVVFVLQVPESRIPRIMGFPDYRETPEKSEKE